MITMNWFPIASCFFAIAIAWPLDESPLQTEAPTRVEERDLEHEDAIIPTSPGQIGINPVYQLQVETDGPYNTFFSDYIDGQGKWTATDTEQITQVQVTTEAGEPRTSTVTAPIAVMTGSDDTLDILMVPGLQERLGEIMESVPTCQDKQEPSCGLGRFLQDVQADSSALMDSFKSTIENIKFLSQDVIKGLATTQYYADAYLVGSGVGFAGFIFTLWRVSNAMSPPNVWAIKNPPHNDFPKTESPNGGEDPDECPKDAPKGKDAPFCEDCSGNRSICQEGKYKHCHCLEIVTPIWSYFNETIGNIEADAVKYAYDHMDDTFTASPYCDKLDTSAFPANLFTDGVYDQFCEYMEKASSSTGDVTWEVDDQGNRIKASQNRRDLEERSPPPDPSAFTNFNATLRFNPNNQEDYCEMRCNEAFVRIVGRCGTTGSELYSMAHEATMDVGCGNYSYEIHSPAAAVQAMQPEPSTSLPTDYTPLKVGPQKCFTEDSWGSHPDVPYYYDARELWDNYLLRNACGAYKGPTLTMGPNHPSVGPAFQVTLSGVPYWFNVRWRQGCVLKDQTSQNMFYPMGKDQPDVTCKELFLNDYLHCNNAGAGGFIDVGCLRYTFKPIAKNRPGTILGG